MWIPARQRWPNTGSGSVGEPPRGRFSFLFLPPAFFSRCVYGKEANTSLQCVHTRQMRPMRLWVTGLWPISDDFSRKKKYSLSSFLSALSGMRCTWMKEGSVGEGEERTRQDDERLFHSSEDLHLGEHLAKTSFKNCQRFLFIAH